MPERPTDRTSEHMADIISEKMPDRMPGRMSEHIWDGISEYMPGRLQGGTSDIMSDKMPGGMWDRMPERIPQRMPEHTYSICQKECQIKCQNICQIEWRTSLGRVAYVAQAMVHFFASDSVGSFTQTYTQVRSWIALFLAHVFFSCFIHIDMSCQIMLTQYPSWEEWIQFGSAQAAQEEVRSLKGALSRHPLEFTVGQHLDVRDEWGPD